MNPKNSWGNLYSIGYWADTKRYTQTHIRDCETGIPVCGSQIKLKDKNFQWCCWGYTKDDYIECDHCKKWRRRKLLEMIKEK